jgi:3-hydroxy acid dehydrogenase/malonic semialdehyde reductase
MSDLKDKIVFISGASSGIGRACANAFSQNGARLVLSARRVERLEKIASELPTDIHILPLDVRDKNSVESAIHALPSTWSTIDILVNNAGLARGFTKMHEGDLQDWEEMIDTNIKGLLYVSRAIIPGMVSRGSGDIINIGSIAGHEVYPNGNVYCATKHAVDALTKGLRMDLLGTSVRVCTVDPGLVETEFSIVRFRGDDARAKKVYHGMKPLSGEDIADAVVYAATRPPHVQIAEIIILPTAQRSSTLVARE